MRPRLDDDAIRRRVAFVLDEASQPRPIRDQTVTFALRVIGNYLEVGQDCQSPYLAYNCRYRSRRAHESYLNLGDIPTLALRSEWRKMVVNEHQYPLAQLWNWIVENHSTLTAELILERMKAWPIVVITKDEDRCLRLRARERGGEAIDPAERYRQADIEVLRRGQNGLWSLVMPT
jgi:hypothetical protein